MLRESMLAMAARMEVDLILAEWGRILLGLDMDLDKGWLSHVVEMIRRGAVRIRSRDRLLYSPDKVCLVNMDSILAGWLKKHSDVSHQLPL
jgi:hypothetical protein